MKNLTESGEVDTSLFTERERWIWDMATNAAKSPESSVWPGEEEIIKKANDSFENMPSREAMWNRAFTICAKWLQSRTAGGVKEEDSEIIETPLTIEALTEIISDLMGEYNALVFNSEREERKLKSEIAKLKSSNPSIKRPTEEQTASEISEAMRQIHRLNILPAYRHTYISAFSSGAYYQRQQPQQKEQFSREDMINAFNAGFTKTTYESGIAQKWVTQYAKSDEYLNSKNKIRNADLGDTLR